MVRLSVFVGFLRRGLVFWWFVLSWCEFGLRMCCCLTAGLGLVVWVRFWFL